MARTISRKARMDGSIKMRAHEEDIANLKLKAQAQGLDVSTFLRQVLIKNGVLNALWNQTIKSLLIEARIINATN